MRKWFYMALGFVSWNVAKRQTRRKLGLGGHSPTTWAAAVAVPVVAATVATLARRRRRVLPA
jgi:hypothetical protein